mmetsp:Transcript_17025/g.35977  ORF Transcript_17025/g.35977 Transcript_17025/m.35977 type:complete len:249 (-) Transcript_17025:1481-2227(-)
MPTCPTLIGYFRSAAACSKSNCFALKTSMLFLTKQSMSESQSLSSGIARRTLSCPFLESLLIPSGRSNPDPKDLARRVAAAGADVLGDFSASAASDAESRGTEGGGSIPLSAMLVEDNRLSLPGVAAAPASLSPSWSLRHMRRKKTFCDPRGSICIWSGCRPLRASNASFTFSGQCLHLSTWEGISAKLFAKRSTVDQKNFLAEGASMQCIHCSPPYPMLMFSRFPPLVLRSFSLNRHTTSCCIMWKK